MWLLWNLYSYLYQSPIKHGLPLLQYFDFIVNIAVSPPGALHQSKTTVRDSGAGNERWVTTDWCTAVYKYLQIDWQTQPSQDMGGRSKIWDDFSRGMSSMSDKTASTQKDIAWGDKFEECLFHHACLSVSRTWSEIREALSFVKPSHYASTYSLNRPGSYPIWIDYIFI